MQLAAKNEQLKSIYFTAPTQQLLERGNCCSTSSTFGSARCLRAYSTDTPFHYTHITQCFKRVGRPLY